MTSGQLRAARALIGWTAQKLADASGVGVATIRRAELKSGDTGMTTPIDAAIRRALEGAGIDFVPENGGGEGVRICKPRPWQLSFYEPDAVVASGSESIREDEMMLERVRIFKLAGKTVRIYGGTDVRSEATLQKLRELGAEQT